MAVNVRDPELIFRKKVVAALESGGGGGIPDAPSDGEDYVRRDATWEIADYFSGSYGDLSGAPNLSGYAVKADDETIDGTWSFNGDMNVYGLMAGLSSVFEIDGFTGDAFFQDFACETANIGNLIGAGTRMVVADLNGDLSTQAIPGGGGSSVYGFMKRSSTSTATAIPTLVIPWQTAEDSLGSDITYDSGNNTRLTVEADGVYKVGGYVTYSSTGQRTQATADILINGVSEGDFRGDTYIRNSGSSWDFGIIEVSSEPFNLTADDYIELRLNRNSGAGASYSTGGSNNVTIRGISSRIWVERVA